MNGVRLKAEDTAPDSGNFEVICFPRFMFSEDIEYTDNYVLIVSFRDRPSSRNTHADLTPVLWPLGPYF